MATLRIVGGTLGGRRFAGPNKEDIRPTPERVREALASALEARDAIHGAAVLDLFAGSGALAFEALSRGAAHATLVDRDRRRARALEDSARALGLAERVRARAVDLLGDPMRAAALLQRDGPFTLTFVDAPYDRIDRVPPLIGALIATGALSPGAWVAIEHRARQPPPDTRLASVARYRYGDTAVEVGTVPS